MRKLSADSHEGFHFTFVTNSNEAISRGKLSKLLKFCLLIKRQTNSHLSRHFEELQGNKMVSEFIIKHTIKVLLFIRLSLFTRFQTYFVDKLVNL